MLESRSFSRTHDTSGEETKRRGRSPRRDNQMHRCCDKFATQKIKGLNARIDAISTGANAPITVDALIRQIKPPFTYKVMKVKVFFRFKLPFQLEVYEGKTDPMDHLDSYKNLISLQGYLD